MIIEARMLTVGKKPDVKFTDNGTQVIFPAAENHSYNDGTRENPNWVKTGTSWYQMVAYGDVANKIIDELDKGDGFHLKKGVHKWNNVADDGEEADYRPSYKILEFEKHEKNK